MRIKIIIFLLVLISLLNAIEIDKIKNLYDSGYYSELLTATADMEKDPSADPAVLLFRAIAFYRTDEIRESRNILIKISSTTGDVRIKDTALYYLALSKIKLNELVDGAAILTSLLNSSVYEVSKNSRSVLEAMIFNKLTNEDYKELALKIFDKDILDYIDRSKSAIRILAVLPLTGPDKDAGKDILSGLEFGVKTLNPKGKKIKLDVVNSEGKISTMTRKVLEKLNSSSYNLIIGELRSDATSALAGIATLKQIPLLSPTASANDISEISTYIFQLNTTSFTLGEKIAEFAIDSLGYKTFATLAPMTDDGNESVSGFTDMVIEKGCSVLSAEWYFDTYDLNKQLSRIRERVLEIDSLNTEEYMSADSIKIYPAGVIDAFFMPAANPDIESILSQVSYYNFKANALGTYGWNDQKMLNKLSVNADSLVFIKEVSFDEFNTKYNDFAYKFRNTFNRNPKGLETAGYSAIEMIVTLQDQNSGKPVSRLLSGVKEYDSANGRIIFKDSRSNFASELYMFNAGKDIKILSAFDRIEKDPFAASSKYFNTGMVYEKTRSYGSAVVNYLTALAEYKMELNAPDSVFENDRQALKIRERIADSYFMKRDLEKASKYFEDLTIAFPENKRIAFRNAVCYSLKDPDAALTSLQEFTNLTGFAPEAYYEIGNIYRSMDNWKKAIDFYEAAVELGSKDAFKFLDRIKKENEKKERDKINFEW
jgi:branched-chain amino acid transport system substrate-binding protein